MTCYCFAFSFRGLHFAVGPDVDLRRLCKRSFRSKPFPGEESDHFTDDFSTYPCRFDSQKILVIPAVPMSAFRNDRRTAGLFVDISFPAWAARLSNSDVDLVHESSLQTLQSDVRPAVKLLLSANLAGFGPTVRIIGKRPRNASVKPMKP